VGATVERSAVWKFVRFSRVERIAMMDLFGRMQPLGIKGSEVGESWKFEY